MDHAEEEEEHFDEEEEDEEDELLVHLATILCIVEPVSAPKAEAYVHIRTKWNEHVRKLIHERLFDKTYRMTHRAFKKLVSLIRANLNHKTTHSRVAEPLSVELMVALTLRYLAGGSVLDLKNVYTLNRSWAYKLRDKVIDAILSCNALEISFPIGDMDKLNEIRLGFMSKSHLNIFHQCLGGLDGMLQPCQCPSRDEAQGNQNGYYSGHYQTHGLNCQGMCDSFLRFPFFAVAAPGKEPDQSALDRTNFRTILEAIPNFWYIVADAAYFLSNKVLTPFTGSQRDIPENDAFNFYLSQLRIHIEMAFGRLVGKWRVLRQPLQQNSLINNIKVIMACVRLHNFVINEDMDLTIDPASLSNDYHDIEPLQFGNINNHLGYLPVVEPFADVGGTSEVRNVILDYIRDKRLQRPAYNTDRRMNEDRDES